MDVTGARTSDDEEYQDPEYQLEDSSEDDPDFEAEDDDDEEDMDEEMEEDEEDTDNEPSLMQMIRRGFLLNAPDIRRLPAISTYTPPILQHELADELDLRTSCSMPNTPRKTQLLHDSPLKRGQQPLMNAAMLSMVREGGLYNKHSTRDAAAAHFAAFHRLPKNPQKIVDRMESRGYIGQFAKDGQAFVAAYQNQKRIKMYDVNNDWTCYKDVHARNLRWTVTDIAVSSDQKFLLYSSITPVVHLVNVERSDGHQVESIANVTDVHEALILGNTNHSNGIWSIQWSHDNTEIIAGTADSSLYIYDVLTAKTVVKLKGHRDDVNAVAYADATDSNIMYTGSDDTMIKIWDRRLLSSGSNNSTDSGHDPHGRSARSSTKAVGAFIGHTEGITHLDSKGDGRYLISNSKDQTIKLWDIRKFTSAEGASLLARDGIPYFEWDYRWMSYPAEGRVVTHPHDVSLATYRGGHSVLSTLIRAYWSPLHTTGQRYIYTGSADGSVCIYDVVTAKVVSQLEYHREVVRDCSWHPYQPLIATVAFDGMVCLFGPEVAGEKEARADEAKAKKESAAAAAAAAKTSSSRGAGARTRASRARAVASIIDEAGASRDNANTARNTSSSLPAPGVDQVEDWW